MKIFEKKRDGKRRLGILIAMVLLVVSLLAAGCGAEVSAAEMDFSFSSRDLDASYDEASAVKIVLADGGVSISGGGAKAEGSTVTLSEEGTYLISGSLTNGQIVVDAEETDKLQIVLKGVSIHCQTDAALLIRQADKVFLTLAQGSENTLTDGAQRAAAAGDSSAEGGEASKVDGVIYSKADLTINGDGALSVTGAYKHGIVSKDDLVIAGGTIAVTAEGQGLAGKDCVKIKDGVFTLNTKGDAVQSDNEEKETKGFIYVCGGTFRIVSTEGDGFQAETVLKIDGGTYDITTGGGSAQAAARSGNDREFDGGPGGRSGGFKGEQDRSVTGGGLEMPTSGVFRTATGGGFRTAPGGALETATGGAVQIGEETASTKGLKAGGQLIVNDGVFTIDSLDDSLHSNGSLTIAGGEITASTGDDGAHADNDLSISGGTIRIVKSYEGIEGKTVTISGGVVDITSSDDGINAAGGSDSSFPGSGRGQDSFSQADGEMYVTISGGTITINASGDGIDSNGNLSILGGTVTVSGPAGNGNGALDYNGTAIITGGVLMGTGSSGMAQGFSDTSTQYSVLHNLSATVAAGSTIAVLDEGGNTVLSWIAEKQFNSVQFSSPELILGKVYTIKAGSVSEEITLNSMAVSNGRGMGGQQGGRNGEMEDREGQPGERPPMEDGTGGNGGMGGGPAGAGQRPSDPTQK